MSVIFCGFVIMTENYKITIDRKDANKVIKRYKEFLSKNDLGKIFSMSIKNPNKDFETVLNEFLEKKYSIDKLEKILNKKRIASYKKIMKIMRLSRSRFYSRMNYIKRFVIKRKLGWVVKKGRIIKIGHKSDEKHINDLLKHKGSEKKILLTPGPVLTSFKVKDALIQHDIPHRDEEFETLMERLQENMLAVFDGDSNYNVLFITGSGTAGLEAAISSVVPENKKLLVVSNGAFGERLNEIAQLHDINTIYIKKEWGESIDLPVIESIIEKDKDIFAIAMNHHETSVGILNPVNAVGELAKKYNKLFVVDAISSLGAEDLSVRDDNIDICVVSTNKCIHSFSGISAVCVANRVWKLIKDVKPRVYYLDLKKYYKYAIEKKQTPFTPAVSMFFAFDRASQELLNQGIKNRIEKYKELNDFIRTELKRLGFDILINDNHSHSILTAKLPGNIKFRKFYQAMKKEGFVVYPCKPPLSDQWFQIANMGELNKAMLYDFIFTVEKVLKQLRR